MRTISSLPLLPQFCHTVVCSRSREVISVRNQTLILGVDRHNFCEDQSKDRTGLIIPLVVPQTNFLNKTV